MTDREADALAGALLRFVRANADLNRVEARRIGYGSDQRAAAAMRLAREEGLTVGDLAEALGLSVARTSRVADELEALGHVRRTRDPEDGRVVRLSLTPAAREASAAVYRERARSVGAAVEAATPEERATFGRLLGSITERFERLAREMPAPGPARRP